MPTERQVAIIEIFTAAHLAGVEAAQKSFLGLKASTLGLAAVLYGVVEVSKAALDNYKQHEEAVNSLTQAYATQKDTLTAHRQEIERFLETNARYIEDQYDTEAALASIIRAGHGEAEALQMLGDSLDIAAIKHENVSDAAKTLILAEAGNARALREFGITTVEYNAIMKSKLSQQEKDAQLLALIEKHTKDGRKTVDEMGQSQRKLNKDWQDFTSSIAPGLTYSLNQVFGALDTGVQILELANEGMVKLGNNAGAVQSLMTQIAEILPGAQVILQLYGIATKSSNTSTGRTPPATQNPARGGGGYGTPIVDRSRGFIANGPFGKGGQ